MFRFHVKLWGCTFKNFLPLLQLQGTAPLADKPISALTFSMTGIATGSCARPGSDAKTAWKQHHIFHFKSADQMASTTLTTLPTLPTIVLHSWIFRVALFHPAAGKNHYQTSSNNKTQPSGSVAKPCEHNTLEDLTHHLCFFQYEFL